VHKVKPDAGKEYKKAAEAYYTAIKDDPELHVKLTGSWETIIGEQDTFCEIILRVRHSLSPECRRVASSYSGIRELQRLRHDHQEN